MVAWFHSISFDVHVVIQMVPHILYGSVWVFHGNLLLKLTVDHFWGNNSSGLEKELKSEKEQRQALQRELQREKDTSCLLQTELQQVEGLKKVRAACGQHTAFSTGPCSGPPLRPVPLLPLCGSRFRGCVLPQQRVCPKR